MDVTNKTIQKKTCVVVAIVVLFVWLKIKNKNNKNKNKNKNRENKNKKNMNEKSKKCLFTRWLLVVHASLRLSELLVWTSGDVYVLFCA